MLTQRNLQAVAGKAAIVLHCSTRACTSWRAESVVAWEDGATALSEATKVRTYILWVSQTCRALLVLVNYNTNDTT